MESLDEAEWGTDGGKMVATGRNGNVRSEREHDLCCTFVSIVTDLISEVITYRRDSCDLNLLPTLLHALAVNLNFSHCFITIV